MAEIIKNGALLDDDWGILRLAEGQAAADVAVPAEGRWIVPLSVWQAQRETLLTAAQAGRVAVWLAGDDEPGELATDFAALPLIAVDFPKFADGRGYSIATLLRTRLGYQGELRAIGNVLRDQFYNMVRCGFDVLVPQPGRYTREQLQAALASLNVFSEPYQGAVDRQEPLFRRRQREVAR
jgi:uncharacterized protein (DUF934 family)